MPTQFSVTGGSVTGNPSVNQITPAATDRGLKLGSLSRQDQISDAGCCCPSLGQPTQICLRHCDSALSYQCGATVKINGPVSGTQDIPKPNACASFFDLPVGTYNGTATPDTDCYDVTPFSFVITSTSGLPLTVIVQLNIKPGFSDPPYTRISPRHPLFDCCGGAINFPTMITDKNGTWPLIWNTIGFDPFAPEGTYGRTAASPTMGPRCTCDTGSEIAYFYEAICLTISQISVKRSWGVYYQVIQTPIGPIIVCGGPRYVGIGSNCSFDPVFGFASFESSSKAFSIDPCGCSSAVSGTLTPNPGNLLPDPVGGTIAIS